MIIISFSSFYPSYITTVVAFKILHENPLAHQNGVLHSHNVLIIFRYPYFTFLGKGNPDPPLVFRFLEAILEVRLPINSRHSVSTIAFFPLREHKTD